MFFIKQELCLSCGKLSPWYCFDGLKTAMWMKTSKQKNYSILVNFLLYLLIMLVLV